MITIKRFGGFKDGRLARFGRKVKKGLPVSIRDVGANVRNNAKNIVPVLTGRLQRSIRMSQVTKNSVFVGTAVPYAEIIEFGSIKQQMQPYLRPAIAKTAKLVGKKFSFMIQSAWGNA